MTARFPRHLRTTAALVLGVALVLSLACQGPVLRDGPLPGQEAPGEEDLAAGPESSPEPADSEPADPGPTAALAVPESDPAADPGDPAPGEPALPPAGEDLAAAEADPTGPREPEAVEPSSEQPVAEAPVAEAPIAQAPIAQAPAAAESGPDEPPAQEPVVVPTPPVRSARLEPAADARLAVGSASDERPAEARYTFHNDGSLPLEWSVEASADWVTVDPAAGDLEPGASVELVVTTDFLAVQTAGPGRHEGRLDLRWTWGGPLPEDGRRRGGAEQRVLELRVRSDSPLGINLPFVADFSSQLPFRNLFVQSSAWIPQEAAGETWNTGEPLDLGPRGWVRSLDEGAAAGVVLAREIDGHYPGGPYVLEYEGKGVVEAGFDARVTGGRPGWLELAVTPSEAGIHLKVVDTDPEDPLRSIRLSPADWVDDLMTDPFQPRFLDLLRPFSVVRFAAWQRINGSPLASWNQRPEALDAVQTGPGGVAIEVMVMLCNELHVEPWFCIPHRADDDFVRRFAQTVRDYLDPDLRVWVEFTSEAWNPAFSQHEELSRAGLAAGLSEDPFQAALAMYARRAAEVFRIWNAVLGDGGERVVAVVSGQAENPRVAQAILGHAPLAELAEAYAIAPWFGTRLGAPDTQDIVAAMAVDQLLDAAAADAARVLGELPAHARLARGAGLALVAYEGGQHLVGEFGAEENEALTALFHEANRHPRMGELYASFLAGWRAVGGTLFCPYQLVDRPTRWGSWGLLEFQDQDPADAPKYRAATGFAFENPRWW